MDRFAAARQRMLVEHLARRGIRDERVLAAFALVPREAFVPAGLTDAAYDDAALPLALGQTISQPYIVALTLVALCLTGRERVLEVGTGSGYAAALLSRLAREVYTVERIPELAEPASRRLRELGYGNVHVAIGDGTRGFPAHAPYDAIAVAACAPDVPPPLVRDLAPAGRLVMPIGRRGGGDGPQVLTAFERGLFGRLARRRLADVWFVPLIGGAAAEAAPRSA